MNQRLKSNHSFKMDILDFFSYKITFLLGLTLFTYGFFPVTKYDSNISTFESNQLDLEKSFFNTSKYKSSNTKLILMIVDALRYDFINSNMQFIQNKIKNHKACLIKLKVETPTVTMPRIKSITTGTISNFLDVVLNLGSSALTSDSIIEQVLRANKNIVFYGDNTWVKLFPNKFFRFKENTDSFFVNDFYEGDKNITRQLDLEFTKLDWNLLILHYLGLDHIGHVEGPSSQKVPGKLKEMDDVAQFIDFALKNNSHNQKYYFVLTADHGMHNAGSHGGGSKEEIFVPLIFFEENCNINSDVYFDQIDITSTLSILLGIPIPSTSIGKIIEHMIVHLSLEDQLSALYYNTLHLLNKAENNFESNITSIFKLNFEIAKNYHKEFLQTESSSNLFGKSKNKYTEVLVGISDKFKLSANYFHIDFVMAGLLMCTLISLNLLLHKNELRKDIYKASPNIVISVAIFLISSFLQNLVIQSDNKFIWIITLVNSILIIKFILKFFKLYANIKLKNVIYMPSLSNFGIVFSIISLVSTSFIEEEHQTWYFLVTTMLIFLAILELQIIAFKFSIQDQKEIIQPLVIIKRLLQWTLLFLGHIFIKRLNQTGDKWQHIVDFGDWFVTTNKEIKLIYFVIALVITFWSILYYNNGDTNRLAIIALLSIFFYRWLTTILSPLEVKESALFMVLFCVSLFCIIAYNFYKPKRRLSSVITIFVLLSTLAHKLHNIILIPNCIFTLQFGFMSLARIYKNTPSKLITAKVYLSFSVGKMFFFYQGNSNNIATIDINTGFIGFDAHPIIAGVFVAIKTYYCPILCFLILLNEVIDKHSIEDLYLIILLLSSYLVFRLNFYIFVMVIFKNHLFIWTVFSPKFLYEIFEFILFSVMFVFCFIFDKVRMQLKYV